MGVETRVNETTTPVPENRLTGENGLGSIPQEPHTAPGSDIGTPQITSPMPHTPVGAAERLNSEAATVVTECQFEPPHNPAADLDPKTKQQLPTRQWPANDFP